MDIQRTATASGEVLKISGRLDAQWADHLGEVLGDVIRQGRHAIFLDASAIDYLSSAGIRILMIYYRRLKGIGGHLTVVDPSPQVRNVLSMSGLLSLMSEEASSVIPTTASSDRKGVAAGGWSGVIRGGFERVILDEKAAMMVSTVGQPHAFMKDIIPESCRPCSFSARSMGLGLGAFGSAGDECRERLGEFLAVSAMAACLPAGDATPDYLIGEADYVPDVLAAYGLVGKGGFSHLLRFEATGEEKGVGLCDIVSACLESFEQKAAGLVIIGENAGLVGASLRSPAADPAGEDFFAHPGVRRRLTFTAERAYGDHVSVAVGFAARNPVSLLDPFLRPLKQDTDIKGHFHAAAFSYRPLPRQLLMPESFIRQLFAEERLQGVLHLLADERPIVGAGESEWVRGICWVSPVCGLNGEVFP